MKINELSKTKLGHYIFSAGMDVGARSATKPKNAGEIDSRVRKQRNRSIGAGRAIARLAREETLDERAYGPTLRQIDKTYKDHKLASGGSSALAKTKTEKAHNIRDLKVNSKGDVVYYQHNEETLYESDMSHEAHELVLHADNDAHLHRSSHQPIISNLKKKMKKGTYDPEKAKKLWKYHADRAAYSYHKQHGSPHQKWHEMFSTKHRKEAAEHWEAHHRDELSEEVAIWGIARKLNELSKKKILDENDAAREHMARVSQSIKSFTDKYGSGKEHDARKRREAKGFASAKREIKRVGNRRVGEETQLDETTLGKGDHAVMAAFANKTAHKGSKKLSTDGKTLDGNWLGGSKIAHWEGDKVSLNDTGGRSSQTIHRALKKRHIPKFFIKG